jgi:hypothetical protein
MSDLKVRPPKEDAGLKAGATKERKGTGLKTRHYEEKSNPRADQEIGGPGGDAG